MLSYQHGYHAGGPADMHKHAVLAGLLDLLIRKARPVTYMDSHAGRGIYDLDGPQARKTGEWKAGLGRVGALPEPLARALQLVRAAHGAYAYPGSPAIARALLRPQDRLVLMELHPAEHQALRAALSGPGVEVHRRDGHEGVLALSPPTPRRGLALIDPSYERKEEYAETAATLRALAKRWPEAVLVVWYPLLPAAYHDALLSGLASCEAVRHEVRFAPHRGRETAMHGSGLLIVNPPWDSAGILEAASMLFSED